MNIDKLFTDKKHLEKELARNIRHVRRINDKDLVLAHLKKARHNLAFYAHNRKTDFTDWLIVALYYALYHAILALITNKGFASKNHYASMLLLIKEYAITPEELTMMRSLALSKDDAELYVKLKADRHDASYATQNRFVRETIQEYEQGVKAFINKTEEALR